MSEDEKCIGVFYRASVTSYKTAGGFGFTTKLNRLKRKSCKNEECHECWHFEEEMNDYLLPENCIHDLHKVEHGKMYKFEAFDFHTDWETGLVDDYSWRVVEVSE